jgi:hypothetical protein
LDSTRSGRQPAAFGPQACRTAALAAALLLASAASLAQPLSAIPRAANGKPDLNGVWQALNSAHWSLEDHAASQGPATVLGAANSVAPGVGVVEGGTIPYLPAAKQQRDANFTNRLTADPEVKCFFPGVPRATYLPHPFHIVQTDGEILIAYQFAGATRTIFMQDHTEAPVDSWMGWSNGRWDGDTLVVDVTGQNGQTWLDRAGNFASAGVHVVERYTPQGPNHIWYEATIEDPTVYSRPWKIAMPLYRRVEPNARLLEYKCVEFAEGVMYDHLRKR